MDNFDVIVLGGGAAGLMCAATAGQRGLRVLVLEGSNKLGKKILMSGGGRCNFTNLNVGPDNFLSDNPNFCRAALARFDQWRFIEWVERSGIAYHERKHGQLFCDDSSKQILAMLLDACGLAGVVTQTHCAVESVTADDALSWRYLVQTSRGKFATNSLVIATGALSIPKMGASGLGYSLARQFELNVLPTRAGLVPFVFSGAFQALCERLSGISRDCRVSCEPIRYSQGARTRAFTEALMFSHRGVTGPVALQLSSYWSESLAISINFFPEFDLEHYFLAAKLERPKILLKTLLCERLARKLALELENLLWRDYASRPLGEWRDRDLIATAARLTNFCVVPSGTEGYRTAEVTVGGIDTDELSSKTLEAKRQPGLFCVGEVVDVTGQLGGFNFQWAWSSGFVAGSYA